MFFRKKPDKMDKTINNESKEENNDDENKNSSIFDKRPAFSKQISAYSQQQLELHEQIKKHLTFDEKDDNSNSDKENEPELNLDFSPSTSKSSIDLASMFPTPNTDLQDVKNLKIPKLPTPKTYLDALNGTTSINDEIENLNSKNISAIDIITENELDEIVKSQNRGCKSWMTDEILNAIEERDIIYEKLRWNKNNEDLMNSYKQQRNHVVTLTRRAKRDFKMKIRAEIEDNIKEQVKEQVKNEGVDAVSKKVEKTAIEILKSQNELKVINKNYSGGKDTQAKQFF